MINMMKLALF